MTPDEKYLLKLHQTGGVKPVNYIAVAKAIGIKETAAKNIVKHLAQANLVKKIDDSTLHLTERGVQLISMLT